MIELYVDPTSYKVRVKDESGKDRPLTEEKELTEFLVEKIRSMYKEAWHACYAEAGRARLKDERKTVLRALERFVRCNFGLLDGTADICGERMELEEVPCPLRGFCKHENVICKPKLTLPYSQAQIYEKMMEGKGSEEIAEELHTTKKVVNDNTYIMRMRVNTKTNIGLLHELRGSHQERRMGGYSFKKGV
jgi:hypothetical protein